MPVYRTGNNAYAIQQLGYGSTGYAANTTNLVGGDGFFGVYPLWPVVTLVDNRRSSVGEQAEPVAGLVAEIGQALEADSATAAGRSKVLGASQALEIDTVDALSPKRTKSIDQATESDSATGTAAGKLRTLAQAAEIDGAQSATPAKSAAVGQATENDATTGTTSAKLRTVTQAIENDSAQLLDATKSATAGQAAEIDEATEPHAAKLRPLAPAAEVSAAQPTAAHKANQLGQVTESNESLTLGRFKLRLIGQTDESDLARPVSAPDDPGQVLPIGQAADAGAAGPVTSAKTKQLVGASEVDAALAIAFEVITFVFGPPTTEPATAAGSLPLSIGPPSTGWEIGSPTT